MPIYEYQCRSCDHRLEKLQKISDAPLKTCPECSEDALVKLVSAAGFRLKGGGWYETDFKKDGRRNLAGEKSDKAGSGSESSSDGKAASESKSTDSGSGDSKSKSSASDKIPTKSPAKSESKSPKSGGSNKAA